MKHVETSTTDPPRRPLAYRPPRLTTYGPVHEVARQHGPGPMSDSGMNMMAPFIAPPS
jgi:hypothetical protein